VGDVQVKLWRSWTSLVPTQTQALTMAADDGRKLELRIEVRQGHTLVSHSHRHGGAGPEG
jgi:hypothetical protein